jgi:hypothetical protein
MMQYDAVREQNRARYDLQFIFECFPYHYNLISTHTQEVEPVRFTWSSGYAKC